MYMELTDRQIKQLEMINSQREQQPHFWSVVRKNARNIFLNVVIYIGIALLCFSADWAGIGFIMIGYLIGILNRDFRNIKSAVSNWEFNRQILNWERIDELLNDKKETT